ncbi:MAG: hypothetical protein LKK00_03400 [Intestinimonas sp.]|jgi:hypothetical protein|nr:hypothetical protein [Intestinimonas sp.]
MKHTLAAVFGVVTVAVLLGATQGTQTDPLVTVSYLNDVVTPHILSQVDTRLTQRESALTAKLDAAIDQYSSDMDAKLAAGGESVSSVFQVVTLQNGKKLTGGVGCEFLLRGGSAVCVAASAPGLIDTTGGSTLPSGQALILNHLYLSTAEGRGLLATGAVTVLVRGSYTIE